MDPYLGLTYTQSSPKGAYIAPLGSTAISEPRS